MTLSGKLLSLGGAGIFGDQLMYDPDYELLLGSGAVFSEPKVFIEMEFNACHWNISYLYENGIVDSIVIGYALSDENQWFQHTWGLKDGRIIETSEVNFLHIEKYFGVIVNDPDSFVLLCKNNPKGSGKVRRDITKENLENK